MAVEVVRRIDRRVPVVIKMGVFVTLISIAAAALLGSLAIAGTRTRIDESYARQTGEVVDLVSAQVGRHPTDIREANDLLADITRTQPSILRVRLLRAGELGPPFLWASSYRSDVGTGISPALTQVPPGVLRQELVALDGEPAFLNAQGVEYPNGVVTVAVYFLPGPRAEAIARERGAVLLASSVVIFVELFALMGATYLLVLRRVKRLERAASRVAAGDLSVRLPEGKEPPSRDEVINVAREFDHMVRAVEARAGRQAAVVELGRRSLAGSEIATVFTGAVDAAAGSLEADRVGLFVRSGEHDLLLEAGTGWVAGDVGSARVSAGVATHPGRVVQSEHPVRLAVPMDGEGSGEPELLAFALAGIGVPVSGTEEAFGALCAYRGTDDPFTDDDVGHLQSVANVLAATIETRQGLERERESEERYRIVVENATELIALVDPEGRFQYASPSFQAVLGHEPKDLVGTFAVELVHPSDVTRQIKALMDVAGSSTVTVQDLRLRHDTGRFVHVDGTLAPVQDAEGVLRLVLWIAHDVTEQREAQEERRKLLARLLVAQEEERLRIAADIHDDPIQAMTAVVFRLESLRRLLEEREQLEALQALSESAAAAVERLRRLMFELRPPSLDEEGLAAALREYVRKEAHDEGFSFSLESRLPREPDPETRAIAYRLAQEALINVRKHAQATQVEVILAAEDGGVLVRISDDGMGFVPSARQEAGHMGLASMRERASLAGGWFRIDAAPGRGAKVEFWIPEQHAGGPR